MGATSIIMEEEEESKWQKLVASVMSSLSALDLEMQQWRASLYDTEVLTSPCHANWSFGQRSNLQLCVKLSVFMTHETEEEPLSVLKEQQQQPEKSSQKLD